MGDTVYAAYFQACVFRTHCVSSDRVAPRPTTFATSSCSRISDAGLVTHHGPTASRSGRLPGDLVSAALVGARFCGVVAGGGEVGSVRTARPPHQRARPNEGGELGGVGDAHEAACERRDRPAHGDPVVDEARGAGVGAGVGV